MESQQQYHPGGQEGRGEERRVNEYPSQQPQLQPPQSAYTAQAGPSSPLSSSSPFAFAPPPLTANSTGQSTARPPLPLHHSEPPPHNPQYQYYASKPPMAPHHHSFPAYPGNAPMGHRSFSNETPRQSPTPAHMSRPENGGGPSMSSPGQPSNPGPDSPFTFQRHPSYTGPPPHQLQSPHHMHQLPPRAGLYPPNFHYHGGPPPPGGADMPRSLSHPSGSYQPHHPYQPIYAHHPHPMPHPPMPSAYQHYQPVPPSLARNDTAASIANGMAGVEIGRQPLPPTPLGLGYAFSSRLPLIERPFKCDECVQSFNRNHDLKRHKRIHLSVKPFGCDKCGKTFSRKDALRRHWLVKGCKGEEGATCPIIPLFPINSTPALSPPTPTIEDSPTETTSSQMYPTSGQGFNHPSAPPPLSSLPARQPSNQSLILITPNDPNAQLSNRQIAVNPPIDEPLSIDPVSAAEMQNGQGSGSSSGDGYFDGVVGIKSDGTAVLEKAPSGPASFPPSAHPNFHPYRRSSNFSPAHLQKSSPTAPHHPHQPRPYTPSALGGDGKPVFAMPFAKADYSHLQPDSMFVPQVVEMEKQNSQMSHASEVEYQAAAPRWHRPSFPFPPTNNVYNPAFDPEIQQAPLPVPTHSYGQ